MMKTHLKVKITTDSLIFFTVLILYGNLHTFTQTLIAVLVHEIGHVLPVLIFGGEINTLTLNAGGFNINYNSRNFTYVQDIICTLAGPMLGILSAFVASHLDFTLYAGISLCINLFNLLPIKPLDGGKILSYISALIFDIRAEFIVRIIELIVLILLFLFSAIVYWESKKISLLVICMVLTFYYCKER